MRRPLRTSMRAATNLFAGLVVAFVAVYAVLLAAGFKPVAVYSGSMEPKLGVGALALDRVVPARDVRVGDVITFTDPYLKNRLVTHRVTKILHTKNGLAYRTKGDANPNVDPWTIRLTGNVGRVSFSVPVAGYVLYYAHTREVRAVLISIAALLLLSAMLKRIWRPEPARA